MATVADIVTRAFRKIGVAAEDDPLTANQIQNGVDTFNDMVHAWALRGVDLAHTDAAAGDAFPLPEDFREGAVYLLAERLAPDYQVPASFNADDWFRDLHRSVLTTDAAEMPAALINLPSRLWRSGGVR